jgi:murein DD-endopeptidase MepM/ murein hydrolase activator NlpD
LTLFYSCKKEEAVPVKKTISKVPDIIEFGYNFSDYDYVRDTIKTGDTFGSITAKNQVADSILYKALEISGDSINLKKLKIGNPYVLLRTKNAEKKLQKFIYQLDKINYYVVDFTDSVSVFKKQKPISFRRRVIVSNIESSLSETLKKEGVDYSLAHELAQIYAWTIDFFKIQKGDSFGVIINEKYINDTTYVGIDNLEATFFNYKGKTIYAFPFVKDSTKMAVEYFDHEAKALKNMFLKAPLKYSRISSKFTPKRFHPVQKIWKAHKGTDYAAPHGADIMATASGVVEKTGYTAGNGNFVKVKHNSMYATQYLHMSKILAKKGQHVQQGQVIGKVGSTGLATGPHLCYRFWKNGVQVDPLTHKIQNSEPLHSKYKDRFFVQTKPLKSELDSLAKIKLKI